MNQQLSKLSEYLDSDEGKKSMMEYFGKIAKRDIIEKVQIDKFHNVYYNELDKIDGLP